MTRYGYRQVSLKEETIERLRLANAWMTGDNGKTTTLSETVDTLIGWYQEARSEASAKAPESLVEAAESKTLLQPHTKSQPHVEEGCDVCGWNEHLMRLNNGA